MESSCGLKSFSQSKAVGEVSHVFALVSAAAALANGFSSTEDRCFRLGRGAEKKAVSVVVKFCDSN